jgi:hypothetical protein
MSAAQIAMIARLPYTALRDAILAHPTFVEGLHALFSSEPSGPSLRVNQSVQNGHLASSREMGRVGSLLQRRQPIRS